MCGFWSDYHWICFFTVVDPETGFDTVVAKKKLTGPHTRADATMLAGCIAEHDAQEWGVKFHYDRIDVLQTTAD